VARHLSVLAVLALGLAGCAHCAQAKPLPRRVWLAHANAICARGDREIHALGGATTMPALARLLEKTVRISNRQLAELRALRPEPLQRPAVRDILVSMEHVNDVLSELARAAAQADGAHVDELARALRRLQHRADGLVARYGVHECLSDDG
jgi:hypothetical protein